MIDYLCTSCYNYNKENISASDIDLLLFVGENFRHNLIKQEYQEYIFTYKNFSWQVNCNISIKSEKENNRRVHLVESLEILEIKGNTALDKFQLKEIIRFCEETNAFEFEQQLY